MTKRLAVDLFAGGARGWDVPDAELGLETIGIESDETACATSEAAGFLTVNADVRKLVPVPGFEGGKFSPPCQTFSAGGKGAGRNALPLVMDAMAGLYATGRIAYEDFDDVRTGLVLEPLRWALDAHRMGHPLRWLVMEQVPPVLPVWEMMAQYLGKIGYSVAVGNLQAEQYGVPQTRKRAALIATLDREAKLPTPTHSRYYSRTPDKLDPGVKKWVSMAKALGLTEFATMRSNYGTGGDPTNRGERTTDQPAPTITSKIDRNKWMFAGAGAASERTAGQLPRHLDQPAHTVTGKGNAAWVLRASNQANAARRSLDTPAPTMMFGQRSNKVEWLPEDLAADPAASGRRVTVEEASILQSLPVDHPWQGSKTQQYLQVGNAIPGLLAKAILQQVL